MRDANLSMAVAMVFEAGSHLPSFQQELDLYVPGRPVFTAKGLPKFERSPVYSDLH